MTLHNSLHTGSVAHPVLSAVDARLAQSAGLALNGPGALDVRLGVLYGPAGFAVTGTSSTSPWQYSVPAAVFVMSKGSTDGPHVGANDGVVLVSTIVPPASNSRYDVVYVMQQDADATISPDATTAPLIAVYNGPASATPDLAAALAAIPAGAYAVASALVLSTATGGTSGAGVTITQQWQWTTTRGAPIPVRSKTERDALTGYLGARVMRLDVAGTSIDVHNGTDWVEGDTGWVTLTLASGAAVSGGLTPQYRRLNGFSSIHGQATSSGSGGLFTLPVIPGGLFIGQASRFEVAAGSSGTGAGLLVVATDGTVYTTPSTTVNTVATWPVG